MVWPLSKHPQHRRAQLEASGRLAAVGAGAALALSLLAALFLGFRDAGREGGVQEALEAALLFAALAAFLWAGAGVGVRGGMALVLMGLFFGLVALREVEPPPAWALTDYVTGHAIRWHLTAAMAAPLAWIAWRERGQGLSALWRAPWRTWATVGVGLAFVALGEVAERLSKMGVGGPARHDLLIWVEETMELCGYVVVLVAAVWTAGRGGQTPTERTGR